MRRACRVILPLLFPLATLACDDDTGPAALLLQVEGQVMDDQSSDQSIAGVRVAIAALADSGAATWAEDSTDLQGWYALAVPIPGGCDGRDSVDALLEASAPDFETLRQGGPDGGFRLPCVADLQTLNVSLVREMFRTPQPVSGVESAVELAVNWAHACIIGQAAPPGSAPVGGAHCWGRGDMGQLGTGSPETAQRVTPVEKGTGFTAVAVGLEHSCALDSAGAAWCWGSNGYGALGTDPAKLAEALSPVAVETDLRFTQIVAGRWQSCGLTAAGEVYCWGDERGLGSGEHGDPSAFDVVTIPTRVHLDGRAVQISSQFSHSCAVDETGAAYCWGFSYAGELGGDEASGQHYEPVRVAGDHDWAEVDAGNVYTCGLTTAGAAYCWGRALSARRGDGITTDSDIGHPVPVQTSAVFTGISAGGTHTCAVTAAGEGYCWGANDEGQLGLAVDQNQACSGSACVPVPTPVPTAIRFRTLQAGDGVSCGITTSGALTCWGRRELVPSG